MPAKSRNQFRYMQALIHGKVKDATMSPEKAKEYVNNVDYKSLPEKSLQVDNRHDKLKKYMKQGK